MFDGLKNLLQRGSAAETHAPVAATAVAPAVPPPIAEWTDPESSGNRASVKDASIVPRVVSVPAAVPEVAVVAKSAEPPMPGGAIKLFDASGVLRAIQTAEGNLVKVTTGPEPASFGGTEADRRPVDPGEELRTDLPQRTTARIKFLLATYEKDRPDLTAARIENDLQRHLNATPTPIRDNPQDFAVRRVLDLC
jgi:hypothetical protein